MGVTNTHLTSSCILIQLYASCFSKLSYKVMFPYGLFVHTLGWSPSTLPPLLSALSPCVYPCLHSQHPAPSAFTLHVLYRSSPPLPVFSIILLFLSHIHLNSYGNSPFPERNLIVGEKKRKYIQQDADFTLVLSLIGEEISGLKYYVNSLTLEITGKELAKELLNVPTEFISPHKWWRRCLGGLTN